MTFSTKYDTGDLVLFMCTDGVIRYGCIIRVELTADDANVHTGYSLKDNTGSIYSTGEDMIFRSVDEIKNLLLK